MSQVNSVAEALEEMKRRFRPEAAKGIRAVYQLDLTGAGGGKYHLVIREDELEVREGAHESPNITITLSAKDFVSMTRGDLRPQVAFMSGRLKLAGDMMLAMKMQDLFPPR